VPRSEKGSAKGREKGREKGKESRREARRDVATDSHRRRRGRSLAGEENLPKYTPDIALRSIDGHLTRTGSQVMAWYRLAAQAWSFRSDSQREVLIRQIAAQLGELQGRWLHIRVTTRPYPVHMWAESFDNNALGRLPDVPGALGWDAFLEGEQRHLMGLSMSDKEVFLGIEVSGRSMLDRWVEKAAPVLGKVAPAAVRAELSALASEVGHLNELVAGSGLDAVPATADDVAWLMHRSCSLGLPAPRAIIPATASRWDTEDLAAFTDGVDMFQEPYAPTVRVVGRLRSATVQRNVAVLTLGLMDDLRIPEVDDPWMQHSDRLPFPVEWSARIYVRRPEEVTGELQRQMGKVRSQIRHYTHDHDLDPPMSLARQADRVLEVEDELTSGLTQLNTRLYGWWRIAVSGKDEPEAISRAQQVLELYRPKVQIEHPEAQYRFAREFIPGEPLASTAYRRRGSVMWAAAAVPAATASVGDRRGIMLGETCTATRRPVAWDPWLAQEVRRASGLTAVVGGLGSGKALALDTPLPTPTGWTTMGKVEVGDELLGRDGRPTRVVAATEVMHDRPCYDVVFSDGTVIRADAQHEWLTRTREDWKAADRLAKRLARAAERPAVPVPVPAGRCACGCGTPTVRTPYARQAPGMQAGDHFRYAHGHFRRGQVCQVPSRVPGVHTTEEIARSLTWGPNGQRNHAVPVAAPFALPEADLPVDPYVLGAWLGGGTSIRAEIVAHDPEIIAEIQATGQECRPHKAPYHFGMPGGLQQRLRDIDVLGNKHIPEAYLRGSEAQRRALLAGLLDTDGHRTKSGSVEFSSTNERLAGDVRELVVSLGYQARMRKTVTGRHEHTCTAFTIAFTPPDPVFRLPRERARQRPRIRSTDGYRYIVDVVPVRSVPVRCVQVDNDDHLYLAGETCIPTHNSFLTGLVVYKTMRAGARWTVLDPSGPLAELTRLPELAPFSRHINLLRAEPGILNPYRVVAEPRRDHFADEDEPERAWRRERSLAAATRRRLVLDVLSGLLPYDVARIPHTRIVLLRAVREVGGAADRHPGQVIDTLRRHARDGEEHAGIVADFLDERRELPQAALLFPDTSRDDPWQADRDFRLTVLTMQGMTLPRPGSPRDEWTDAESLAVELLNLASWLTQRTIYDANRNLRKGVALDETHFLSQVPTGKVLIDRLARDSRKFNVRALFASQLAGDLLRVSGFASLVNAVFVGRTDDEEAQAEALRLLRVPTGVGYEQMLGTLSPRPRHDDRPDDTPRQFVFADGHGGVEKIRIDLEAAHLEHVREALDTNPDASRVMARGIPGGGTAAALRAPDEPAPAGMTAVDDPTEAARRAVRARNGAPRLAVPAPADGTELLDDEDLDLFDDLDEVPEEPHSGTTNGSDRLGTHPGGGDRVPGGAVR
jgi:AAA-like domain/LAGLIDADG-like domain